MVTQINFLTGAECERAISAVYALRPHWQHRDKVIPFYTLGAASYLDAAEVNRRADDYYGKARRCNPLLIEHFHWLYEKLAASLGSVLGAPCRYEERLARPGFHVFLPSKDFEKPMASVHLDLQYQLLDWSRHRKPDFTQPLSFTGSLALPSGGGGLNTWDIKYESVEGPRCAELIATLTKDRTPQLHRYVRGGLVIHSGHTVHQIAPMQLIGAAGRDEARITLQGHAIQAQGTWWLYW